MAAPPAERLSPRALNRALLARQGLLERVAAPLPEAVEAIGPVQAQQWSAPPIALWSRVAGFVPADLHAALDRGDLVTGTLLRATLHLVSAREHPAYAAVVAAAGTDDWRRTRAEPSPEVADLRAALLAHATDAPRTAAEIAALVEAWLAAHPGSIDAAEVEHQRRYRFRAFQRWAAFVRAPAGGAFGAKAPALLRAAPGAGALPDPDAAFEAAVRRHLRAFGPAGADDVAGFLGSRTPPVRAAFERLEASSEVERLADADGRALLDLRGAPRPDQDTPAPPRLLAPFDSVLLAYAARRRTRILPDAHRTAVYERANLRILPTFLVDGLVAGTWSVEIRRREATLTLRPLGRFAAADRAALVAEAERLARAVHPHARSHAVVVA